jgi:hypothetical protein
MTPAERIAKARAMRAEHAQASAYYAHRADQARAAAHHQEAARWTHRYRRSVTSCRLLGALIRGDGRPVAAAQDATVVPLAQPRAGERIPTNGAAA